MYYVCYLHHYQTFRFYAEAEDYCERYGIPIFEIRRR